MNCSPRPVGSPFMLSENGPLPPEEREILVWTLCILGVMYG